MDKNTKKYFFTGLIILIPIVITFLILEYVFNLFTAPVFGILENACNIYTKNNPTCLLRHSSFVTIAGRLSALFLTLAIIFVLGFSARKYFFRKTFHFVSKILDKIPFVKSVYHLSKDVTEAMLDENKTAFKETVLIPFPSTNIQAMGFVTGELPPFIKSALPHLENTVFIPTAPHPISGFLVFTSHQYTHTLNLETQEAFKFLISCGTTLPKENAEKALEQPLNNQ
ncbi:MAG: DUF502 domain-containing protein [Rhabdochlamydiaceae bacterium]